MLRSPESSPLNTLSAQQQDVLKHLVAGKSVTAAARQVGVHRTTVHLWTRTIAAFSETLLSLRQQRADRMVDEIGDLADAAIITFQQILIEEKATPSVRLKAAMEVVKLVEAQRPTIAFPDSALIEKLHQDLQLKEVAAQSAPAPSKAARESEPAKSASPVRNAPCPCGSRLNYERCCGNPAQQAAPQARAA